MQAISQQVKNPGAKRFFPKHMTTKWKKAEKKQGPSTLPPKGVFAENISNAATRNGT